jgi:nuclear transport factor 2 (NTF2) superfamily protein
MVNVPVSVGELIDKLSILQVKKDKVKNPDKLKFIEKEYELLLSMSSEYFNNADIISTYEELVDVNTKLWEVEDELRVIENTKVFDNNFIELARAVYYTNDERFRLKDKINNLTNSEIKEQKDYKEYK